MLTGRKLFVTVLTIFSLAIPSDIVRFVYAVACHDDAWDQGEYCGYDAMKVAGVPDMNHDCLLDALDFQWFAHDYNFGNGGVGVNLSADFKSSGAPGPAPCGGNMLCPDGKVNASDYSFFVTKTGQTASPCTAVPIPSVCNGSIALSFSTNPNTIVSNAAQLGGVHDVYVVLSGVVNAEMAEFAVKKSPNVTLIGPVAGAGYVVGADICSGFGYDADYITFIPTLVASGPTVVADIQYVLNDSKPAWISIVPVSSCPYAQSRWTDSSVSLSHLYATMKNVGINGTTPANTPSACTPLGTISGQVYVDKNFNCAYTAGTDDLLANLTVQATLGTSNYFALTDASGNYTFKLPAGTYTVKMAPAANDPWKKLNTSCGQPATYSVGVAANGTYPNKDFAIEPTGKISGNVYRDFLATTACAKDGIDYPIASRILQATSTSNYLGYSDNNGDYAINVPSGAYNVTNYPVSGDPYTVRTCQSPLYSVNVAANTTYTGKDFALDGSNLPCNIFLSLVSHGFNQRPSPCWRILEDPCPGFEHEYIVTLKEELFSGAKLGTNKKLDINLDPKFTIGTVTSDCSITFTSPNAHQRIVTIANDITPGYQCIVKVRATPSTDGPYTNTVTLDDLGAGCLGTKVRTLTNYSSCPCDPNDMAVQPIGCGPDGQVAQGSPLTYSIQFENVGTGKAHNIFVEDVLDDDLDLTTVSIVASSHPVTGMQVNGNKLVISFEGIDLPGSLTPAASHGKVVFTVRPLPVAEQFDSYVENTASITFDFEEPVITNTVINTLVDDPCVTTAVPHDPLPTSNYLGSNYPNPFNPSTTITYGLAKQERVTIAIYNVNGALVRTLVSDSKPAGWYDVNWDGRDQSGRAVASGIYFSQMRAGSFSDSKKLVLLK